MVFAKTVVLALHVTASLSMASNLGQPTPYPKQIGAYQQTSSGFGDFGEYPIDYGRYLLDDAVKTRQGHPDSDFLSSDVPQTVGTFSFNRRYTKHIEKDAALERRFQRVNCEEASIAETLEVLDGLRPSYEAQISPDWDIDMRGQRWFLDPPGSSWGSPVP